MNLALRTLVIAAALAVTTFVVAACADGFSPQGDDDDDKFDQVGAQASTSSPADAEAPTVLPDSTSAPGAPATETPVPAATPTPLPTATPRPTATPTPLPTATPTPSPTPMFPPVLTVDTMAAAVGDTLAIVVARDSDAEVASVEVLDGPAELTPWSTDGLTFAPTDADTSTARVRVTDTQGLTAIGTITLTSRYRGHPQALVALGDSVASGHGLELVDYLGGDPCWRAPNSYPRRTFNALNEAGVFEGRGGEFALLACSGYDVDDLWERDVTGGFKDVGDEDQKLSQLEWAVRTNPRFVTLTIGANDTGFVGPARLFLEDGSTLDRPQVDRRMRVIERDLTVVVDRLVAATDATIFVSNYYNPVAERPQGTPNCRLACFKSAADEVVGDMNDVIRNVVEGFPGDRVVFVDFETPFIGKGAPNGVGLDSARESGFGRLGELIGADQIGDVHPYCARGETVGASWINPVDCVHPDERGTTELAQIMATAIQEHIASAVG